eukprot:scaffold5161_cov125-Isochrysis_galbana.AAC.4
MAPVGLRGGRFLAPNVGVRPRSYFLFTILFNNKKKGQDTAHTQHTTGGGSLQFTRRSGTDTATPLTCI